MQHTSPSLRCMAGTTMMTKKKEISMCRFGEVHGARVYAAEDEAQFLRYIKATLSDSWIAGQNERARVTLYSWLGVCLLVCLAAFLRRVLFLFCFVSEVV